MIYTIEKADRISEQLRRFTFGFAHHVAGQFSNIDFWINEVIEATNTIDFYNERFNRIKDSQTEWMQNHGDKIYEGHCPYCGGKCELTNGIPSPPKRISSSELKEARKKLIDSAYYFLTRCYRMELLDKAEIKQKCDLIGTSIDPNDLKI